MSSFYQKGLILMLRLALIAHETGEPDMPRYFVRVEVRVETDEPRLIAVELEGRLLDGTTRPPGVRVADAQVISAQQLSESED